MVSKYFTIFRLSFGYALQNRKAFMGLSIFLITCLIIFAELWKIVAVRMGALDLNPDQLLWYIAFNEWVLVSFPDIQDDIESDLRSGRFGYLLPRPISYLGSIFAEGMGKLSANLLVLGIVTFGFTWFKVGFVPLAAPEFLALSLIGVFAGVVGTLFLMLIGISAFWIGQIAPFESAWEKLLLTLGGLMLPLTIYPDWLQTVAKFTPFPMILGGRSVLVIDFHWHEAAVVSASLLFWALFVLSLLALLYRRGLKKVNMEGG